MNPTQLKWWPRALFTRQVDTELANLPESRLAGILGPASARAMLASLVNQDPLRDTLTGLPNRAGMYVRLDQALELARVKDDGGFALLLLSLDRFRVITDTLGSAVGDQLLIRVAKQLNDIVEACKIVARVGREEFAVLLSGPSHCVDALRFADGLHHALGTAYKLDHHEIYTTFSIGVVADNASYEKASDMLRDAQIANHRAVAHGGACIEVFEPHLRDRAVALFDMETMLHQAVHKGDNFEVHYQPIVMLATGRLAGFEALVRMRRVDGTLVPPGEFIPLTEETGLIVHIGHWVMVEACRQMRAWQRQFPKCGPLQISVNLAGRQFRHPQLVQEIEQVLSDTGLDTAALKLEVTETVIMEHAEQAAVALAQLRSKGIQLLMDDFGTGCSSLAYLRQLPLHTLKIDASFVRKLDSSREDAGIVQTIVSLAHTLGMDIVAEGVETVQQMTRLRELNVEYGQGYYFAKPLDHTAAEALIADWPHWSCPA